MQLRKRMPSSRSPSAPARCVGIVIVRYTSASTSSSPFTVSAETGSIGETFMRGGVPGA